MRRQPVLIAFIAAACLAGCGEDGAAPAVAPKAAAPPVEAGYLEPPAVTGVETRPEGVLLKGTAAPRAEVRLATPQGAATVVRADEKGRWEIGLTPSTAARIFGLSLASDGRVAQAEGYVLVGPQGQAAVLRAGAGAVRLDAGRALRLSAIDFDRAGGAIVSGEAPSGAALILQVDGREAAQARARGGHFSIALPTPVQPGVHEMRIFAGAASDAAKVTITQAEPLASGPVRGQSSAEGLRVDWMTPGGGLQSTLLTP